MAVEPTQQIEQAPVQRWRFTVDDYYRMGEVGILPPDARVELINGDVIQIPPIGSHHQGTVTGTEELFRERLGRRVVVSGQGPLLLRQFGTPQPDILILRRRDDHYRSANPTAADVLLLITALASSGVRPYFGVFTASSARGRPTDGHRFARFWEAQDGVSTFGQHDARVVLGRP